MEYVQLKSIVESLIFVSEGGVSIDKLGQVLSDSDKKKVEKMNESGKKKGEYHYKNGKPDGLGTEWYESGGKSSETHYKNGKKEG